MAGDRKNFLLYREWGRPINLLSDAQAGILLKSFFKYWDGEAPTFDDEGLKMISSFIFAQFDRDSVAYQKKCAANQANGKKGGRPKTQQNPTKPKKTERFLEKPRKPDEDEEDEEDIYTAIADSYNRLCPSLPRCSKLSDQRKRQINARLKEGYTVADFEEVFRRAEASDFLSGRSGAWTGANFSWLIKSENMLKIMEGHFENPQKRNDTQAGKIDFGQYGI